tara:strand:- start:35253 stop:35507 length:255 start_codon:yes stop_codon:yes gene_type:complete
MVKNKSNNTNFYYIQCGDWEGVTVASSPRSACLSLVSQAIDMFKDEIELTDIIVCSDCKKSMDNADGEINAFQIESILEEIHEH